MSIIESSYIDRLSPDKSKKRKIYKSITGSGFVPVYEYAVNDGVKTLVRSSERDMQSEIESFAESCDINNIINRFLNGDTSMIRNDGIYGDFTDVPDTYAEIFKRVQQCENVFNSLPVELRKEFDNSYQKFWSDFGSDSFNGIMDKFYSSQDSVVNESEVVDNAE